VPSRSSIVDTVNYRDDSVTARCRGSLGQMRYRTERVSELSDATSELVRSLVEIAWHFGPRGLNDECCDDLTMAEFIALDRVAAMQDCPVNDVGSSLGFTKSGATRVVNRLEKKGYANRIRSSEDARVCCVEITDAGKQVLLSADSRYMKQFDELVSRMPHHSASDVASMITAMGESLKS